MFMFKKSMVEDHERELKDKIFDLENQIKSLQRDEKLETEKLEFEIEKARYEVRKQMQKDLIESDLKRVEAVAKLNTYIDMDTKDERKHIAKMLEKAIESLGKSNTIIK